MSKLFIEDLTLIDIADAIREKEGTTELVPVTQMAARITNLPSGGGGNEPTDEELTITGNTKYYFYGGGRDWIIERYGNKITTKDITDAQYMFGESKLSEIPFTINVKKVYSLASMFEYMTNLSVCPKIRGTMGTGSLAQVFNNCEMLRDIEDAFLPEMLDYYSTIKQTSAYSGVPSISNILPRHSLRRLPTWWYKFKLNPESGYYPQSSYTIYSSLFNNYYVIDEILNIPVWKCNAAITSNYIGNCGSCFRLGRLTFETNEDGSPIVTEWKSQTIDLSSSIGYVANTSYKNRILNYNSGITADKEVIDDATYQALKNDPDWFTTKIEYSRYNHDSAVATINSLPDTSAYLATAGGTNTIKFKGASGSLTDGGAINTLTAEEIAVAAAKGWTVALV